MASVFTCTACSVSFSTSEAHKTHYKLDWHRYNLRRKVAGLAPVDQGDFDRRLAVALRSDGPKTDFQGRCKECRKSFRSEGLYKQHLQSKKHKEAVKHMAAAAEANTATAAAQPTAAAEEAVTTTSLSPSSASMTGGGDTLAAAAVADPGAGASSGAARHAVQAKKGAAAAMSSEAGDRGGGSKSAMEVQPAEDGEGGEEEGDDEGGAEEELVPPRMGPGICIFCNLESTGFEENCSHMLQKHGFFIPDVEFLKDPEGLVGYVEEKVKLGHICLYCNGKGKTFHTYRALQQHMADRSHCKLLYDEDEDLHEYESFYDFSASYSDAERRGLVADDDTAATAPAAADGEEEGDSDGKTVEVSRTLGVTDLGELVLLDGKTVGNRKWSRYYKQRLRTPDERDMAVAHRQATRLRLGAMYDEEMQKGTSTGGAVALQRGQRKAYGGLAGVSRPKDVKMLRAHQRSEARERLKTEIRQNKLNKTFDRIMDM